tara:strand:- start:226 stop:918 length:693 start_codon:yes stop_codon:yes gene_type:complete
VEKIVYQLWKKDLDHIDSFKEKLLTHLPSSIDLLVSELQINIHDQDVAPANSLVQSNYPPAPDAIIFIKVESYFFAKDVETQLLEISQKIQGFIVSESIILNDEARAPAGQRSEGFSQIVFLEKPSSMSSFDWFEHWTNHHTEIAIETQSNFIYIQNSILRPLQQNSPRFIAIIEECFPAGAMSNTEIFYNAPNDPQLLLKNTTIMMDSCSKFIDFNKIEVIPTSRYRII